MADSNSIFRIFISSPGDVIAERDQALRVVEGLQRQYPDVTLRPVLWEGLALPATASFQESIDFILKREPIDVAVFILWTRLGSPLGAAITRRDGTAYRSGTEREFDLMLAAFEQSGRQRPVILAYTRDDASGYIKRRNLNPDSKVGEIIKQRGLVKAFIREQFYDSEGHNLRAYHTYQEPVGFAQRLRVHLRQTLEDLVGLDAAPRWAGNPYRGLRVFDMKHALIFHGRDEETCDILQRLRDQARDGCSFVVIVGPSGSGKSSLARAGVAANLVRHADDDVMRWRQAVLVPRLAADSLSETLATALTESLPELRQVDVGTQQIAAGLVKDPALTVELSISPAFARASEKDGGSVRLLLVLDQMEELWTDRRITSEDRAQFLLSLEALARSGHVAVLATLRSDFYPQAQVTPTFLTLKGRYGHFDLLPPGPAALGRLITEPARLAGVRFERDESSGRSLDQVILDDASDNTDALPLLEYTLDELYRQLDGTNRQLSLAAYSDLGGVEGALGKRVETVFACLPEEAQRALPDILQLLITVDVAGNQAAVRRRAPLTELTGTPARKILTSSLIKARFLTTGKTGRPEIQSPVDPEFREDGTLHDVPIAGLAHEALLVRWQRAADWIATNHEYLRLRARVEESQRRWEQHEQDASLLLPFGLPLEEGRQLLRNAPHLLSDGTRSYLEASIANQEFQSHRSRRRTRAVVYALTLLTVLAMAGGGVAFWQARVANALRQVADAKRQVAVSREADARRQARIANAARLVSESRRIRRAQPALSALLAIEAVQLLDVNPPAIGPHQNLLDAVISLDFVSLGTGTTNGKWLVRAPNDPIKSLSEFYPSPDDMFIDPDLSVEVFSEEGGNLEVVRLSDILDRSNSPVNLTRTEQKLIKTGLEGEVLIGLSPSGDYAVCVPTASERELPVCTFDLANESNVRSPVVVRANGGNHLNAKKVWVTDTGCTVLLSELWTSRKTANGSTSNREDRVFRVWPKNPGAKGQSASLVVSVSTKSDGQPGVISGRWLGVQTDERKAEIYDLASDDVSLYCTLQQLGNDFENDFENLICDHQSHAFAVWSRKSVRIWREVEVNSSVDARKVDVPRWWGEIETVSFGSSKDELLVGFSDGFVAVLAFTSNGSYEFGEKTRGHRGRVTSIAWSDEDAQFVTYGSDSTLMAWEIDKENRVQLVREFVGPGIQHLSLFFAKGPSHVIGTSDEGQVYSFNISPGGRLGAEHSSPVSNVLVSPDGTWFASCSVDGELRRWRLSFRTGKVEFDQIDWPENGGRPDIFYNIKFAGKNQFVGTGWVGLDAMKGRSRSMCMGGFLWAADATVEEDLSLRWFPIDADDTYDFPRALEVTPSGRFAAICTASGRVQLWDLLGGAAAGLDEFDQDSISTATVDPLGEFSNPSEEQNLLLGFMNDGRLLAAAERGSIVTWKVSHDGKLENETRVRVKVASGSYPLDPSASPTPLFRTEPAGVEYAGAPIESDQRLSPYASSEYSSDENATIFGFAAGNSVLVVCTSVGWPTDPVTLQVFQVESTGLTETALSKLAEYTNNSGYSLALSDDESTLVVAPTVGGVIRVLSISEEGRPDFRNHLIGQDEEVACWSLSPNGTHFATGSVTGTVRVWNLADLAKNANCLIMRGGHSSRVNSLAFAPDGRYLISGGDDHVVRFWPIDKSLLIQFATERVRRKLSAAGRIRYRIGPTTDSSKSLAPLEL